MTFRRVQFSVVVVVLSALFLASGVAQPVSSSAAPWRQPASAVVSPAKAVPAANWTWQGRWTQFSAGACRDIYRDAQGGRLVCHHRGGGRCEGWPPRSAPRILRRKRASHHITRPAGSVPALSSLGF